MSCKRIRKISTFLLIVALTFYNIHLSFALSEAIKLKTLFGFPASRDKVDSDYHQKAQQTLRHPGSALPIPASSALPKHRSKVAGFSRPTLDRSTSPKQLEDPVTYEQGASELSWTFRNGSELRSATGSDKYLAYQADDPGFQEIHEGNTFGTSFDDNRPTHSSEWQAMRPLVQCDDTIMTLTASGQGYSQLFVDREGDFPISVFHLPPNCGYSVKASWNGLVVEAPYDGCYMTQENGSYVLPMLWWDSPLRLSCPVQKTHPSPLLTLSVPWALCSPYGVAVHVYGTDEEIPSLGTIVKDDWEPLVSAKCAYRTEAPPGHLLFYIPLNAPCLEAQEGLHLRVLKDDEEFSLSCQDPSSLLLLFPIPPPTPPLSPVDPQYPHPPDPITPAPVPTTPSPPLPQSMTQGQVIWPPGLLNYPHPGLQFPHLPLVYPPGSQPSPDVAPGPPPQFSHLYSGPDQQQFPPHPSLSPPQQPAVEQTSGPNVDPVNQYPQWPPQHGFHQYDLYMPFYGSQVTHQAPVPSTQRTTSRPLTTPPHTPPMVPYDQQYNPQQSYQLPHTFSQVAQSPESIVSPAIPAPPQQLLVQHQPLPYVQYYPYWSVFIKGSVSDGSTPAPSQPPTTPTSTPKTMGSKRPTGPDHKRPASRCPPNAHPFCGYYPVASYFPLPPAPPYPPPSQHTTPVTPGSHPFTSPPPPTSTSTTVRSLTPQPPRLQCFSERMMAFLPSPHPDSIQVRVLTADFQKAWLPLSSVSPLCKFMLLPTKEPGLMFESPLPACHSQQKTPSTLSLRLRFWDVSLSRKRILELRPGVRPPAVPGQGCNIPEDQRLPCGTGALTQPQCLSLGCCFNRRPPACHYPMDECTHDLNFVFSVPASLTDPPLSPALLVAPGNPSCKPQRVTADYALFLIPMDGCGARRMVVGKTLIYILEIVNKVESITLDYGTITRDSPVRILVECLYKPGPPLVTAGYMTKIPSLGPGLPGQGVFGVQLRIAKDAQYNSFHPQYHVPLRTLLGQPLYLEVRLVNPPDLQLVLLVHYCVAYPRSGAAMWVLLYKECPNPFDPAAHNVVLASPESQTRRFTITTFQFLQKGKTYDLDQEIYFMCSTEACVSQDGPCVEGCLGQ
ncbi:unnamed protein product [Lota lota]